MEFVDGETLVVFALQQQFPSARVVTELPARLEDVLPVFQVERIGGADLVPSLDNPLFDIECFAATRIQAKTYADQVRSFMRSGLVGASLMGAVVLNVLTSVGPNWRPYGNTNVFRVGATYQIALHNQF